MPEARQALGCLQRHPPPVPLSRLLVGVGQREDIHVARRGRTVRTIRIVPVRRDKRASVSRYAATFRVRTEIRTGLRMPGPDPPAVSTLERYCRSYATLFTVCPCTFLPAS